MNDSRIGAAASLLGLDPDPEVAKQLKEEDGRRENLVWSAWNALRDYQRGRLARLDQLMETLAERTQDLPERLRERVVGKVMLATVGLRRAKRHRGRWPIEKWEAMMIYDAVVYFSQTIDSATGKTYPLELDYDHKGKAGETAFQAAAKMGIRKLGPDRVAKIFYQAKKERS